MKMIRFSPIPLLACLAVAAAMLLGTGTAQAAQCKGGSAKPGEISSKRAAKAVLCLVNKKRQKHGSGRLHRNDHLTKAARKHTDTMVSRNCFSHTCPGEPSLQSRLSNSGYLRCSCTWGIGENIGWGPGSSGSPRRIVAAWMRSSMHRSTLLSRSYDEGGVGLRWRSPNGGGKNAATVTLDVGYKR